MTEVGVDDGYVGVEPVANYYKRNLRIFANLTRVVEPGDRVLVVYGAGHQAFLQEFVEGHPDEMMQKWKFCEGRKFYKCQVTRPGHLELLQ